MQVHYLFSALTEEQDSKEPGLETETFAQKMSKITEAFGSEKRKRLMAASQRNKLDMTTLDATLAPAIEMAQEHVDKSGSCAYHVNVM